MAVAPGAGSALGRRRVAGVFFVGLLASLIQASTQVSSLVANFRSPHILISLFVFSLFSGAELARAQIRS